MIISMPSLIINNRIRISHLLIVLLFFLPLITYSQNSQAERERDFYSSIESLKTKPNTLKLVAQNKLLDRDSLQKYYKQILEEYQDRQGEFNTSQNICWLYEIGYVELSLEYVDLGIKTFEQTLKLIDKQNDPKAYKQIKMELGDAYRNVGKKKKSNETFLELLELPIMQQDTMAQISCIRLMAENYENLNEYQKALELCLQLYNYSLRKNNYAKASYNLIQMGRMAAYIESDTTYFEYFHLANTMAVKSGIKRRIGNNLINTGNAYRKAGFPIIALKYLLKAKQYANHYTTYGYVYNLLGLSSVYILLDSIQQAYSYAKKSKKIAMEINAHNWVYHSCERMAICFVRMNKNDSAKILLQEAVGLSKILLNESQTIDLYKQLSDLSITLKDYASAVAYLDSSYVGYTKLITETNDDKLAQLRLESDYYIHKTRISELLSNNKIEKEKRKQLSAVVIGILLVLALSIISIIIIRKRLRQLRESYVNLVKKSLELDSLNNKLHECEIKPARIIKDEDLIIDKLKKLLIKEEVFTNSDLSLKSLAEELETNTSYLSAIINSHFNINLKSLLNKHRINKARKMLVSKNFRHYSMEGIATEVGFKSRSAFYQTFKTDTGLSPTQYIENYNLAIMDYSERSE